MKELQLIANDMQEQKVLAYLQENASEVLIDKINNGTPFEKDGHPLTNKKTLASFMKYACDEAQKIAEKGARSVCVDDDIVYGWAIHYFEEESIEGTLYTLDGSEYKPAPPKKENKPIQKPKPQEKKQESIQFSFFDNPTENDVKDDIIDSLSCDNDSKEEASEDSNAKSVNPIWLNYKEYKKEHPSAIIVQRIGDFYEMFDEDATAVADIANLTITSRDFGLYARVPMVGFPYHAKDIYIKKILQSFDIYLVENDTNKQFIKQEKEEEDWLDDEDLTEEEMQEFDGDLDESVYDCALEDCDDASILTTLKNIFGNTLEVK